MSLATKGFRTDVYRNEPLGVSHDHDPLLIKFKQGRFFWVTNLFTNAPQAT